MAGRNFRQGIGVSDSEEYRNPAPICQRLSRASSLLPRSVSVPRACPPFSLLCLLPRFYFRLVPRRFRDTRREMEPLSPPVSVKRREQKWWEIFLCLQLGLAPKIQNIVISCWTVNFVSNSTSIEDVTYLTTVSLRFMLQSFRVRMYVEWVETEIKATLYPQIRLEPPRYLFWSLLERPLIFAKMRFSTHSK